MRRLLLVALFLITSIAGFAQRQNKALYVPGGQFKSSGWFIAPGVTLMRPFPRNESLTGYNSSDSILFDGVFSRDGGLGFCIQAGRHHFISRRGLIDHVDYGVGYKKLKGSDQFSGVPSTTSASFKDHYLSGFANISNIIMLTDRWWVQNSLGVNVDFAFITNRSGSVVRGAATQFPAAVPIQAHYRLGFGWKPEPGIFIMPMIEFPVLNLLPWEGAKGTLPYFTGRYRPVLITLRIQWLSKQPDRECDAKAGGNVDLSKSGKHGENDLFGPDARKMKRKKKGRFHFLKRS
jgi:hypothetical protein